MNPEPAGRTEVEVEWQLDALDLRPVERWLAQRAPGAAAAGAGPGDGGFSVTASARPVARLVDVYFDTEDWRVGRSGFVLRCRQKARGREATLKELSPASDGLRKRLEATEPLGQAGTGVADLDPEGAVGRRVRSLAGGRPLRPVLEVRTRRRPFDLAMEGTRVGEVALDETVITFGGEAERLTLRRVEVEVGARYVDSLSPLVEQLRRDCGLHPAMLSKFEAGLMAAGITLPRPVPPGGLAIPEHATAGEAALAVLRREVAAMLDHEAGTRLGDDPEELHQMRVATRRQRAALSLFAEVLPARAVAIGEEVRWLAALLGTVRDLDVQMERLHEWAGGLPPEHQPALDELAALLRRHREAGREQLLGALDSRRYERLVANLHSLVDHRPARPSLLARRPALVVLPDLVSGRHRAAVKAARTAERSGVPADFHQLRIRCKRLRYAIEFTAPLYGSDARRMSKKVAGLQDELGLIQDAEAAAAFLSDLAIGPGATGDDALAPPTVFAMGMVAERCHADAARRLRELGRVKQALKGAEWKSLAATMRGRRSEAEEMAPGPARPAPHVIPHLEPITGL